MPDLIDHDYEAEEIFYNQQMAISNNYNEITISDLSSAFTNSNTQYYYPGYNLFTDNINVITHDMDNNDNTTHWYIHHVITYGDIVDDKHRDGIDMIDILQENVTASIQQNYE